VTHRPSQSCEAHLRDGGRGVLSTTLILLQKTDVLFESYSLNHARAGRRRLEPRYPFEGHQT
jgi:hypothetical protein